MNWLTSIFSSEVQRGDLIKARALNTTKLTAILVPLATAVAGVVETQVKGPLEGLAPAQKLTLWIAMFALLGLIVISDMFVRALTTSASLKSTTTLLPTGLKGSFIQVNPNLPCSVVAARSFDGQENAARGEFLIVYEEDEEPVARWVESNLVSFVRSRRAEDTPARRPAA